MDLISLLVLCATLAIAFIFKSNSGLVSIAVSLILSLIVGVPEKFLISSFNNSLFLMLLGVMYLFSIAQENKTLELLSKRIFDLCKGNTKALPVVIFLVAAVISSLGPGLISVTALVSVLIVALAKEINTPAIRLIPFGLLGAFAGGLSPIAPTGIVAINVSGEYGITGVGASVPWKMALTCCIYAIFLYFFVFKWHKQKKVTAVSPESAATPAFSAQQIMILAGILVVAVVSSVFKINVGLVSFAVAVILTLFKAADESAALKKVPWSTLVMITGVGILISLVTELGGIDLLSVTLSKLSTTKTVAMIMSLLSGVMSWVSSASGDSYCTGSCAIRTASQCRRTGKLYFHRCQHGGHQPSVQLRRTDAGSLYLVNQRQSQGPKQDVFAVIRPVRRRRCPCRNMCFGRDVLTQYPLKTFQDTPMLFRGVLCFGQPI